MFLSAGEDGVVFEIDLRQQSPAKLVTFCKIYTKSEIFNKKFLVLKNSYC
jgi:hypothetical protein